MIRRGQWSFHTPYPRRCRPRPQGRRSLSTIFTSWSPWAWPSISRTRAVLPCAITSSTPCVPRK
jgi:hypothetical protein